MRNQHIESIEVSLATPHGNLLVLPPGKTLITLVFRQVEKTVFLFDLHTKTITMLGGSLTRYHTPTLTGKGFTQELVKLAGLSLLRSIGHGLQAYEKGASASDALKSSGEVLKRGLKCKLPAVVRLAVKTKAKQSYKKKRQRVKDILGV